jgi:hypothetical protein
MPFAMNGLKTSDFSGKENGLFSSLQYDVESLHAP